MICPVCERDNGEVVLDPGGLMCVPCQRVVDIVQAAPIDAYLPLTLTETTPEWMRRLQDELADRIKEPA